MTYIYIINFIWYNIEVFKKRGGIIVAKVGNRNNVTLRCEVCKEENYRLSKNKKNTPERLEINKYCPRCQKHTVHKEKK